MFTYILHGTSSIVLPTVRDTSFKFWQSYPWNKGSWEEFNKHFFFFRSGLEHLVFILKFFCIFSPINSLFTTFAYIWLGHCFFFTYKFKSVNYKLVIEIFKSCVGCKCFFNELFAFWLFSWCLFCFHTLVFGKVCIFPGLHSLPY